MNTEDSDEKSQEEQLEELRKQAYDDPDCTAIDGAVAGRDLPIPVGKELEIEVLEGPRKGVTYRFPKGNIIFGRSSEADFMIDDDKMSRKHAVIEAFSRDQAFISDLASTNGTFLNGMRVRSIKLKDGDEIKIGRTAMKFSSRDVED